MYPSIITNFPYPTPANTLNAPSHSGLHNLTSSTIGQIETVIGTSDSILGTIIGDLRNPASNGGGHIQTAVTGGTGQTTYNKGDILVAINSSTLAKQTVGTDGQNLISNSSTVTGMNWGNPPGTKIFATASLVGSPNNVEQSIFSTVVAGSTLGTNNVVRATTFTQYLSMNGIVSSVKALFGGNVIASVVLNAVGGVNTSMLGEIKYTLMSNQATNAQRGILQINLRANKPNPFSNQANQSSVISYYASGTSSVESSANQTMGMTLLTNGNPGDVQFDGTIVEKIL